MQPEAVFTFPNTHHAIAGEKALDGAGVAVRVMPRPAALGDGCGICLRVGEDDRAAAVGVLRGAGVAVEAVFLKVRREGRSEYRPVACGS